jgi:D-glycerate 3-kinase
MATPAHPNPRSGFKHDLVERVLDDALSSHGKPPIYGITGTQGSGKSTLARQVAMAGKGRGLVVVALSIDDFYLGKRERQALARSVHPLLATRGPPGTHDLVLAAATLDKLRRFRHGDAVSLPRFDKLGDRRLPPSRWRKLRERPDLIILEGWFLTVPPEPAARLKRALNAREREDDADGRWRRYCNERLADYAPIWRRIDRLLWLRGPGFDVVPRWRWQQEVSMHKAHPDRKAMTRAEVARFVQLFERVSRQAERALPKIADVRIVLDKKRRARFNPPGK